MDFVLSELRALAQKEKKQLGKPVSTIIEEENKKVLQKRSFDIFLSHRMLDGELILGIKLRLEYYYNYTVYVDWVEDTQLNRELVNKDTASKLRDRMKQSRCLMYVYTKNSTYSKWMPWELGYMDGYKPNKSTILPIKALESQKVDEKFYADQEYLNLYPPTIEKGENKNKALYVYTDEGEVKFSDWLNKPNENSQQSRSKMSPLELSKINREINRFPYGNNPYTVWS